METKNNIKQVRINSTNGFRQFAYTINIIYYMNKWVIVAMCG